MLLPTTIDQDIAFTTLEFSISGDKAGSVETSIFWFRMDRTYFQFSVVYNVLDSLAGWYQVQSVLCLHIFAWSLAICMCMPYRNRANMDHFIFVICLWIILCGNG